MIDRRSSVTACFCGPRRLICLFPFPLFGFVPVFIIQVFPGWLPLRFIVFASVPFTFWLVITVSDRRAVGRSRLAAGFIDSIPES
jgi:hypothetical protein